MGEFELDIFITIIRNYFEKIVGDSFSVQTPYLSENLIDNLFDYTSRIQIGGLYKGFIYFSASPEFSAGILNAHNQKTHSAEMLLDAVGEVANTLSGNARKDLSHDFLISTPYPCVSESDILIERKIKSYVIPLVWNDCDANLVVNMAQKKLIR